MAKQAQHGIKTKSQPKHEVLFIIISCILALSILLCSLFSAYTYFENKFSASDSSLSTKASIFNTPSPYSDLKKDFSAVDFPSGITTDFKELYAANSDTVGWLKISGTEIDYPIVQCSDNDYYLENNFYKKYTKYGTPFLDFQCGTKTLSKNTLIYGHNMSNETAFGQLKNYTDISYFKKHPLIKYNTLYKSYTFKIYAAFYSTTEKSADNGYIFYYISTDMSNSSFNGYIEQVNERKMYSTGVDINSSDKIITLSTCTHLYDYVLNGSKVDTRFVVVGRLLRSSESEQIDTSEATNNPNYRRPQIWYNKHGKTNPYSSRNWYPSK